MAASSGEWAIHASTAPYQGAFDHGPPTPVVLVELVGHRVGSGGGQQVVVGVEHDDPAVGGTPPPARTRRWWMALARSN